jgi:hypothetical protein
MDIATVYDWFARDCIDTAEQTDDPRSRELLLKLAVQWAADAQRTRDEASKQSAPPNPEDRVRSGRAA